MDSKKKATFIGIIFILVYIYVAYVYITKTREEALNEIYSDVYKSAQNEIETLIEEKQEAILLLSLALSESDNIKKFLLQKDPRFLHLQHFSDRIKKFSSLHNVWFHIVSPKGVSLYRSWSSRLGDDLIKIRPDIKKVIQNQKIISTISVGKYDISFKSIVPIFYKEKFIGIVETIAKFNSISRKMNHVGFDNLLLVDKRYQQQLSLADSSRFLDGYYIANKHIDFFLVDVVKQHVKRYIHINSYLINKKDNLFFTNYILRDINGDKMAYFILAKNLDDISIIEVNRQTFIQVLILSLILMVIVTLYIVNYQRFTKQQKKLLEATIKKKTFELERKSQALRYQAEHDILTQLPNRLLFLDRLKEALKHAKRGNERVSVLFLDLDRFKEINDTYGHETGDELLKQVAQRLQQDRREEDTVARLGGDEFTLLIKNVNQNGIIHLVSKIIKDMQKPFIVNGKKFYTTFSIGISSYPEDGETSEELLRNADTAMYTAKKNGKNQYYFYQSEMTKIAFERMELEKELRKALQNDEFVAYYQPKIDAKRNKVIGMEALIRWEHPQKGMIFPDKFIPFAEEIGLIDAIDNKMMYIVMQQVLKWHQIGVECGRVSINLSAKQLASKTYLQELKNILDEVGLDTKYLEIEITETHIMSDPNRAMEILAKVRDLGISIAIDDFGTGYSSLLYLKKLPITKLKIDRSFVMDLPESQEDVSIVKTIISLAKNLKLETIAEGVEKKEQVDFLVQEGCVNIQGYYFSKPLSTKEFEEFVKKYNYVN